MAGAHLSLRFLALHSSYRVSRYATGTLSTAEGSWAGAGSGLTSSKVVGKGATGSDATPLSAGVGSIVD